MVAGRVPFEASVPSEVMKKHLKEPLVPPDHINTALSTGISEVIEVMMAKDRGERYATMEEVIADLEAVRGGKPPLLARQKFNFEALGELEEGAAINLSEDGTKLYPAEVVAKYRVALIIVGAFAGICLLAILFMLMF
jgi:serine/threonine-protein kinase